MVLLGFHNYTEVRHDITRHHIDHAAGPGLVYPHMLRSAFIMAALDAGVPLRDVQIAARHAAYVVVAFVASG